MRWCNEEKKAVKKTLKHIDYTGTKKINEAKVETKRRFE